MDLGAKFLFLGTCVFQDPYQSLDSTVLSVRKGSDFLTNFNVSLFLSTILMCYIMFLCMTHIPRIMTVTAVTAGYHEVRKSTAISSSVGAVEGRPSNKGWIEFLKRNEESTQSSAFRVCRNGVLNGPGPCHGQLCSACLLVTFFFVLDRRPSLARLTLEIGEVADEVSQHTSDYLHFLG